ncbi:unnamed protein product [Larinioides sclopetarius]|uniref:Uncharacterized protein n=1 Tax=Larinioides sclopetarius TaxID=280406 RepID=A0AAV2B3T0_9ARAC
MKVIADLELQMLWSMKYCTKRFACSIFLRGILSSWLFTKIYPSPE